MPARNATAQRPATCDRLRETALAMFSTHGYQATSLRDIARELGVQAGSLYHHIENKQALLFELLEDALECLLAETRQRMKKHQGHDLRLRQFVQAAVEVQCRRYQGLQLIDREACNLSTAQQARIGQLRREYHQCLQGIVSGLAVGRDYPQAQIAMLTHAVLGMINGAIPVLRQQPLQAGMGAVESLLAIIHAAIKAPVGPIPKALAPMPSNTRK